MSVEQWSAATGEVISCSCAATTPAAAHDREQPAQGLHGAHLPRPVGRIRQRVQEQPDERARCTSPGPASIAAQGALPIKVGDEIIGAVGVSGSPGGDKDEACAKAGLDKVADQLK